MQTFSISALDAPAQVAMIREVKSATFDDNETSTAAAVYALYAVSALAVMLAPYVRRTTPVPSVSRGDL